MNFKIYFFCPLHLGSWFFKVKVLSTLNFDAPFVRHALVPNHIVWTYFGNVLPNQSFLILEKCSFDILEQNEVKSNVLLHACTFFYIQTLTNTGGQMKGKPDERRDRSTDERRDTHLRTDKQTKYVNTYIHSYRDRYINRYIDRCLHKHIDTYMHIHSYIHANIHT